MPDQAADPAWETVLAAIEAQVAVTASAAEHDVSSEAAPSRLAEAWAPPAGLGQLPGYLEQRARDIIARQRVKIGCLEDEQRTVGRHLEMLRSVPPVRGDGRPVYLDVTG